MKANELRIGNIVKSLNTTVDHCFIEEIKEGRIQGSRKTYEGSSISSWNNGLNKLEPILITPDWLINKFGFKDNGGGYYQHPEYNFFLFHIEEDEYFECYKQVTANDDSGDFKTLQHVHKLQNLFYELFDEELTVKG